MSVESLTLDSIKSMTRSDIRYALFRCRTGNPTEQHLLIYSLYEPRLIRYGLKLEDFSDLWDISIENVADIVSGHVVHLYKEELSSLFDTDGKLKE